MTDNPQAAAASAPPDQGPAQGQDEIGTLRYLVRVCNDAADTATQIAKLLTLDGDREGAAVFSDISVERSDFTLRLLGLLADRGDQNTLEHEGTGTFTSMLRRWRLAIARRIPVGYTDADDRRWLMRIASHSADTVTKAYADATARSLGPVAGKEVRRQAEAIRASHDRLQDLVEKLWEPGRAFQMNRPNRLPRFQG